MGIIRHQSIYFQSLCSRKDHPKIKLLEKIDKETD